jgi:hypothetical protein
MTVRRFSSAGVFAAALLAAACEQPASSAGPAAQPSQGAELTRQDAGLDGEFLRVQRQVPGFAGYYFDQNGDLTVLLTDLGQESAARGLLRGVAADRPRGPGLERAAAIRMRRADYDFATLNGWHRQLGPLLALEGVDFIDTDEAANRVVVGVTTDAAAARVREEATRLGVARGALVLERVAGGRLASSLRDRTRPVKGGVEIAQYARANTECTLGYNVRYTNLARGIPSGTRAFLTASHCTAEPFRHQGGRIVQGGSVIGHELVDPGRFTSTTDARCPVGARCRWSDAAMIAYEDSVPWALGYIAKPLWSTTGSSTDTTTQVHSDDSLRIVGRAYPAVGAYVNKVGRTTGWTWGPVTRTCADFTSSDDDGTIPTVILCQTEVSARATGGDSGSPAFIYTPESSVTIAGIVWREVLNADGTPAQRFVFSPLEQIRSDMGGSFSER